MSTKVLVVDDSKNIQKVVNIILDDKNFEIESCSDYADLDSSASSFSPELVLLDFGISEEKSAYEIAKELKETHRCKVILLYGTFDSVDEDLLESNGIDDYIFKPFDGDKLLKVCETVLGEEFGERTGVREMTVETPKPEVLSSEETITRVVNPEDALGDEEEWGIKIPGVIGVVEATHDDSQLNEDMQRVPDIISDDTGTGFQIEEQFKEGDITPKPQELPEGLSADDDGEEQTLYPSDEDLEYPSVIEEDTSEATETKTMDFNVEKDQINFQTIASTSKLMSSEDLLMDPPEGEEQASDNTEIVDMELSQKQEEENLNELKKQILEEIDDDRWQDDDNTNTTILVGDLGKDSIDSSLDRDSLKADILAEVKEEFYQGIKEDIVSRLSNELPTLIKEELIPTFEEHIQNYCKEAVEKGIWEILPDLADKVISKELGELRKSVESELDD